MALQTINIADKETLDQIKEGIEYVQTNTLVTGMTHAKRFTSDAVFTVPPGITEIIMLGCASGKGIYAGNFLLPTRYTVVPGEEINIVCGMDSSTGYKDTVITSPSLGTIRLLAGTISDSLENNILGIPLGITGGQGGRGANQSDYNSGGPGGYGGLYGIGGGGAGGSGGGGSNWSGYGSSGSYPGGAGGGWHIDNASSSYPTAKPYLIGNNAGGSPSGTYGGRGGNGQYYGAGGGGTSGKFHAGAAGKPSGGMVQIEW